MDKKNILINDIDISTKIKLSMNSKNLACSIDMKYLQNTKFKDTVIFCRVDFDPIFDFYDKNGELLSKVIELCPEEMKNSTTFGFNSTKGIFVKQGEGDLHIEIDFNYIFINCSINYYYKPDTIIDSILRYIQAIGANLNIKNATRIGLRVQTFYQYEDQDEAKKFLSKINSIENANTTVVKGSFKTLEKHTCLFAIGTKYTDTDKINIDSSFIDLDYAYNDKIEFKLIQSKLNSLNKNLEKIFTDDLLPLWT